MAGHMQIQQPGVNRLVAVVFADILNADVLVHDVVYLRPSASRMALLLFGLILPPLSAFMTVERLILAFLARSSWFSP